MTDASGDERHILSTARPLAWGGAAALVLLPLLALKVADANAWEVGDLMFAAVIIGGVGLAFELAVRTSPGWTYRAGAALAVVAVFLLTWGNLAVGFVGSEDNPINIIYFAMPAIAVAGALFSGFRANGMAVTMAAAAVAQVAAGLIALVNDSFTGPLTVFFTGLWLASACLFRRSGLETATGSPAT